MMTKGWAWTYGVIGTLLCFAGAYGEGDNDLFTLPNNIKKPEDVQEILSWKERCRTEVGEQAVKDIEDSKDRLVKCVGNIIKWEKLQHEINVSIERGELELVFKKYCGRRDQLMGCVEDVFTKVDVCMNERERQDLNVTRDAIDAGLDFVCHKDGDRIALFMGEKGEECVRSQKDNIRNCIEERVPDIKDLEDDQSAVSFEKITINEENCKKIHSMHQCIVKWTEKCEDSTPANILDSLIVQILNVTPCKQTSSAPTLLFSGHDLLPRILTLFAASLTAANILL